MANPISQSTDFTRNWRGDHNPLPTETTVSGNVEIYNPYINTESNEVWLCTSVDPLTPNQNLTWKKMMTGSTVFPEEDQITIAGTLLNSTYYLVQKAKHTAVITSFVASCASLLTAGTYTIRINGVAVTGLTGVANTVSSTETNATANNTFGPGDVVTITFAGSLTLLNFQGQLSTTRVI